MSRYYFNIRDSQWLMEDPGGVELNDGANLAPLLRDAVEAVLAEAEWEPELSHGRSFEIVDEFGELVATIPFSDLPH